MFRTATNTYGSHRYMTETARESEPQSRMRHLRFRSTSEKSEKSNDLLSEYLREQKPKDEEKEKPSWKDKLHHSLYSIVK